MIDCLLEGRGAGSKVVPGEMISIGSLAVETARLKRFEALAWHSNQEELVDPRLE